MKNNKKHEQTIFKKKENENNIYKTMYKTL